MIFKLKGQICRQHNLSVKAEVFPGSITPFILLMALHPFFLHKQLKNNNKNTHTHTQKKQNNKNPC